MADLVWACGRVDHGPCFMQPRAHARAEPHSHRAATEMAALCSRDARMSSYILATKNGTVPHGKGSPSSCVAGKVCNDIKGRGARRRVAHN